MEHLGSRAQVYPGVMVKDRARAAIQTLSGNIQHRTVYTHTGMRKIGDQWHYLHGGGAIGPDGPVTGIEVVLHGSLAFLTLPDPPDRAELVEAIRASVRSLKVAPDSVTVPILAAAYRAVLGDCDQSVFITGQTGVGKTELAALAQQHFGAEFSRTNLPASWSSTANAMEVIAFTAKDALIVIDDFCPAGTTFDAAHLHKDADRILRAQGNRSGRNRLNADSTMQATKWPRGMILATGEDVPRGQSLRARLWVVDVEPDDVNWQLLTQAQDDARKGKFAQAMSGYVQWLTARYDAVKASLCGQVAELRKQVTGERLHKKTPTAVANLAIGLRYFLDFAAEVEALDANEVHELWGRCWDALLKGAEAQTEHVQASEPTGRFLELVLSAVASGQAHLAGPDGRSPKQDGNDMFACAWGWRHDAYAPDGTFLTPQGERIGWIDGDNVYLEPTSAYKAAQKMVGPGGDGLMIGERTLRKRLRDKGLLASTDDKRQRLTVRPMLEGKRQEVLHFLLGTLLPQEPAQPAQADQTTVEVRQA